MDGLVTQMQSLSEPLERHAQVNGKFLRVDASAGFVVQSREDNLQPACAAQERLEFRLDGGDLALQFGRALEDFRFGFR